MVRIESERYPIVSAGIDWVSMRTRDMDQTNSYDALAQGIFEAAKESGEKVERSVRVGYAGRNVSGCFFGHKEAGSLITLSGQTALQHGPLLIRLGGSVARLDLQTTIDTGLDKPNIASLGFYQSKIMKQGDGRPRELKLTQTHPTGDTLNVGKRTSDYYGRVYDYGAAHATGEAHRFWRYEIEFKRTIAKQLAASVAHCVDMQGATSMLVHSWYEMRLPSVMFAPLQTSSTLELLPEARKRDVLRWFEESLSKTVARAIKDYGRERVLKSLGLHSQADTNEED